MALTLECLVEALRPGVAIALSEADFREARDGFLDTLAVAHAGRGEQVIGLLDTIYPHNSGLAEIEALKLAVAAHALDYDDVQMASVSHASAVLVPALIAAAGEARAVTARTTSTQTDVASLDVARAYLIGLRAAAIIGRALGPAHYMAGWHATSTIGPIAAAAAVACLWQLDDIQWRHAMSLATCQASGMQRSFGAMAKPLQAGVAASAGIRAATWGRAGITGGDTFAAQGFWSLYGAGGAQSDRLEEILAPQMGDRVSRKAYPCCYASHRLISAALALREMPAASQMARMRLTVQSGTLLPLTRQAPPICGNDAKFCGEYLVAAAFIDGSIGLGHFTPQALERPDIRRLSNQIDIVQQGPPAQSLEDGVVSAACIDASGHVLCQTTVTLFPGSPMQPLSDKQLDEKMLDCCGGQAETVLAIRHSVDELLAGSQSRQS